MVRRLSFRFPDEHGKYFTFYAPVQRRKSIFALHNKIANRSKQDYVPGYVKPNVIKSRRTQHVD